MTVASVAKNLMSVSSLRKTGHEVVFSSGKSCIRHLKTDARQPMVEKNWVFEVGCDLSPYAVGKKPPPRRTAEYVEAVDGTRFAPLTAHLVEELRLPSMMVKTSETWNSRLVRDL